MIVGIGVDITEIARLRTAMQRHKGGFARRVFTPAEQQYCDAHADPAPHYAARFAAKEALFKAIGTGWAKGVKWADAEIQRAADGAPLLVLRGEAGERAKAMGANRIHVSLSHSDDNAIAFVILEN